MKLNLQEELNKAKETMWEMMNYLNLFVVVLDKEMHVVLANRYLIYTLGFESEKDVIGRCWLDFIESKNHIVITHIHDRVRKNDPEFTEVVTEITNVHNNIIAVRWFNSAIDHGKDLTFSIGIPLQNNISAEDSTRSIRSYFRNIIQKDKTFISAMKHVANEKAITTCTPLDMERID
jgi:transcriptional regulator with PAS, ATPase and Fis domain